MYDPVQGRMLSPDNYVADALGTQGYNRYSYANNNPLVYTDPDGNLPFLAIAIPIIKAIAIGAGVGALGYTASVAFSEGGFRNFSANGFLRSAGMGAISGLVSFGVGSVFGTVGSFGKELMRGFMHGYTSGLTSAAFGGNFESGFLSGAFGSLAGSGISAYVNDPFLTIGASALSGGIGSEIGGGNFWEGATTGAIIAGLNHGWHQKRPDADGILTLEEANEWFRKGNGKDLYVDASKLDLQWVKDNEWVDGTKIVQTLFASKYGRVYGNITLSRVSSTSASISRDRYNFEQHGKHWYSSPVRNPLTRVGKIFAGSGKPFWINFTGHALINTPGTPILPPYRRNGFTF